MKVVFSNRAFTALLSEVYEKIKTETGGVLLGYYENDTWYIVEAIDPGPKSIFEVAYFEYDQPYVNHLINKVARIYKKNLSLIGLWHRHPGSFDVFSGTDDGTNTTYAKMAPQGAISALVNIDPVFRLTVYHVGFPLRYRRIKYEVGDELFPDGVLSLHSIDDYVRFINTYSEGQVRDSRRVSRKISFTEFIAELSTRIKSFDGIKYRDEIAEATKDPAYVEEISQLIDEDLNFMSEELHLNITVRMVSGYVCLIDGQDPNTIVYFSYIKSIERYVFIYHGESYLYEAGLIRKTVTNSEDDNQGGTEKIGLLAWLKKVLGL